MICSSCRTFLGQPCAVCRTYQRIGLLLADRLVPSQETQALSCLRVAAGHLQDLAETSGRRALGVPTAPPFLGEPSEGKAPLTGLAGTADSAVVDKSPAENRKPKAGAEEPSTPKRTKEEIVEEEKKQTSTKEETKEETTGDRPAPESSRPKEKEKKEKASKEKKESKRIKREEQAARGVIKKTKREVDREQERVDRFVSAHPESFGLGSLPVKGSAGRHFKEREEKELARRPPEPDFPPPRRRDGDSQRSRPQRRRSRSREKKKKSKGVAHRERGKLWRQRQGWRPCPQR